MSRIFTKLGGEFMSIQGVQADVPTLDQLHLPVYISVSSSGKIDFVQVAKSL